MKANRLASWALAFGLMVSIAVCPAAAEQVVIQRNVTVREGPLRSTDPVTFPAIGTRLELLDEGRRTRGYYRVRLPDGREGWVYYTFVRRVADGAPQAPLAAPVAQDRAVVHFIDVDQGATALLEFPCGAVLIDAGGWGTPLVTGQPVDDTGPIGDHIIDYLDRFFERRADLDRTLSAIFVTHAHIDHNRYLKRVAERYRVRSYVHNGTLEDRHSGFQHAQWMDQHVRGSTPAIPWEAVEEEDFRNAGTAGVTNGIIDPVNCPGVDPEIRVLAGGRETNPGWSADDWGDDNNHSLVVRVSYGDATFLFSGDMEIRALEALVDRYEGTDALDADVWAVGHHGSHNGITRRIAGAVTPDVAVISVGPHDRRVRWSAYEYGHPRDVVINELERVIRRRRSTAKEVMVATAVRRFQPRHIREAIFATAWDGDVTATARPNGSLQVGTSR